MTFKYKKELVVVGIAVVICLTLFLGIKHAFFTSTSIDRPLKKVMDYYQEDVNQPKMAYATTEPITSLKSSSMPFIEMPSEEEIEEFDSFYQEEPTFKEDGSIIYDGLTMTELTDKLNRSLNSYLANTGYFFAEYTKKTGLNPYLSVAIVLLETGCKWKCSSLTVQCNNIGGLKGRGSCNGTSYSRYDSLDEGIASYLDIIYNNYYLKGLDTPEKMGPKYAASSQWAMKVNRYIEEVKSK